MNTTEIQATIERVERLLAAEELSEQVERAVRLLLNVVEAIAADNRSLADENKRLQALLEEKKKSKTTTDTADSKKSDHSSEQRRRKINKTEQRPDQDRRSFKNLVIHKTIECPVDPVTLPPDAVRLANEIVTVQDIVIQAKNTNFERHVYFSKSTKKTYRGELPAGYDQGDFSANLRALILSLKYCGNMSEPKIGEFLENFDVQVSAGSISNILTNTAKDFEHEYHDILMAGLASTSYQQTDDTSARVKGQFWHTHILCNPYYTFYSTRRRKDRLDVLKVLQNTSELRFSWSPRTLELLRTEFSIPEKWLTEMAYFGDWEFTEKELQELLDEWFEDHKTIQVRTAIEQASAIIYYQDYSTLPVVQTLVCDAAGQFKLLTRKLALCWIHEGRHYEKLSPVVKRHAAALDSFLDRFWNFYAALQDYRAGPGAELADQLRVEFDILFATRTGYIDLDDRIERTQSNRDELLTVLSDPTVPLHNNASELGARVSARRRDVSLHSRSERGARSMDIFTTIVQTAKKHSLSAYAYLRDRLSGVLELPSLATTIQQAAASV